MTKGEFKSSRHLRDTLRITVGSDDLQHGPGKQWSSMNHFVYPSETMDKKNTRDVLHGKKAHRSIHGWESGDCSPSHLDEVNIRNEHNKNIHKAPTTVAMKVDPLLDTKPHPLH